MARLVSIVAENSWADADADLGLTVESATLRQLRSAIGAYGGACQPRCELLRSSATHQLLLAQCTWLLACPFVYSGGQVGLDSGATC